MVMMMVMTIIIIIRFYIICAGTTATSLVTETAQEHNGISQIQATNGVISWSRHAASSGF
jgi:hypothetical protein